MGSIIDLAIDGKGKADLLIGEEVPLKEIDLKLTLTFR